MGIPCVTRLRHRSRLAPHSRVWPFETGFTRHPSPVAGPFVLHVEIWPRAVEIDRGAHPTADAAQVLSLGRRLAELDQEGDLGSWFDEPSSLSPDVLRACVDEEGWILGA